MVEFLLIITPGSGLMYMIFRFIKANAQIGIARTEVVRADAKRESAEEIAAIAGETARLAMDQTTEALGIARTIDDVHEGVRYIIGRIDGQETERPAGRHSRKLPSGTTPPAIEGKQP
jgi:hypothetical protein